MGGVRVNLFFNKNGGAVTFALNLGQATGNLNIADSVTVTLTAFAFSAWHHLAVVRNGAHYYAYFDGVKTHDISNGNASFIPVNLVIIPAQYNGYNLFGWIDEFKYSSTCEYPGGITFTPPTAAFV